MSMTDVNFILPEITLKSISIHRDVDLWAHRLSSGSQLNKALDEIPVLELQGPSIWDQIVTCHPTQMNAPNLNPSR